MLLKHMCIKVFWCSKKYGFLCVMLYQACHVESNVKYYLKFG